MHTSLTSLYRKRRKSIMLKETCNKSEWAMSADNLSADAKSCFKRHRNHPRRKSWNRNYNKWGTLKNFLFFCLFTLTARSLRVIEMKGDLLHYKWLFAWWWSREELFGVFVRNIYISFLFAPSDCFKFFPRLFKRKVSLTTHYYGEFLRSVEMSRCLESRGQLNATWKSYLLARKCFFFLELFFSLITTGEKTLNRISGPFCSTLNGFSWFWIIPWRPTYVLGTKLLVFLHPRMFDHFPLLVHVFLL